MKLIMMCYKDPLMPQLCQTRKAKSTLLGVKFWCNVCHRHVKDDNVHRTWIVPTPKKITMGELRKQWLM